MPCRGEGIGGISIFVEGDSAIELVFADVAPLMKNFLVTRIRVEVGRSILTGQTVSETMEMLKLVILRAVVRRARLGDGNSSSALIGI